MPFFRNVGLIMCIIPSREIDYYWDRKLTGTIKGNIPALTVTRYSNKTDYEKNYKI